MIKRFRKSLPCLLCALLLPSVSTPGATADSLETDIHHLKEELNNLPEIQPTLMPWTRGLSYHLHKTPDHPVIITLLFSEPAPVDLVAIMPSTCLNEDSRLESNGFPVRFHIEGLQTDGSTLSIADYREQDYPKPGVEPQLFPCPNKQLITGLRITATRHAANQIWPAPSHVMALSEVMAFADNRNVALNSHVDAPGNRTFGNVWTEEALVDGFTLFSPVDARKREPSREYITEEKELILDFYFDEAQTVDEFWMWPLANRFFTPASGIGFPQNIKLEALSDSGEPQLLYQSGNALPRAGSNPLMKRIQQATSRRFRFTLSQSLPDFRTDRQNRIILGEIQLLNNGNILTAGLTVQNANNGTGPVSSAIKITDGITNEGAILPLRPWVEKFQRRITLERKLNKLQTELTAARRREREHFKLFSVVAIAAIVILALLVWVVRLLSARKWERIRERIACDLHDQIGANLSSIAHSNELIRRTIKNPTQLQSELLKDTVRTAQSTARETRQIVKMLEEKGAQQPLAIQMERAARHILGTIETSCQLTESTRLSRLNPSQKWDLLLFFKEVLNNVIKHSGASHVDISLNRHRLTVSDNGCGISNDRLPLRHLEKRAKILKGNMTIQTGPDQGTHITLNFKRGFFK